MVNTGNARFFGNSILPRNFSLFYSGQFKNTGESDGEVKDENSRTEIFRECLSMECRHG